MNRLPVALAREIEAFERPAVRPADKNGRSARARVLRAADVQPEEVEWLWWPRIPLGKLTDLAGDPGEGKSTIALDLAARVTTGAPMPGATEMRPPAPVLIASAEDGAADTIRPRLDAAGADVTRAFIFDGIERAGERFPLNLRDREHVSALAELVATAEPLLVVVDPITAYLGDTDSHKDSSVRRVLAPLADLAERSGCAVLAIRHLRKSATGRALYRAGGSIAFTGAVRSQLLAGHPPDEQDNHALAHLKSNLGKLADPIGYTLNGGAVRWTGPTSLTAAALLAPEADDERRSERGEAVELLRSALKEGPRPARDILATARELGISNTTLHRAKREVGVRVDREGFGPGSRVDWHIDSTTTSESMGSTVGGIYANVAELRDKAAARGLIDSSGATLESMGETPPDYRCAVERCGSPVGRSGEVCGTCRRTAWEASTASAPGA